MVDFVERHRTELEALCRRYHVKTLEAFGSSVDGTFDPRSSDVDLLVQFLPEAAERIFHGYFDLKESLEALFARKVDLVMPGAIRNPYFLKAVNEQRKVVYAA